MTGAKATLCFSRLYLLTFCLFSLSVLFDCGTLSVVEIAVVRVVVKLVSGTGQQSKKSINTFCFVRNTLGPQKHRDLQVYISLVLPSFMRGCNIHWCDFYACD